MVELSVVEKELEEAKKKVEELKKIALDKLKEVASDDEAEEKKEKQLENLARAREKKAVKEKELKSPLPVIDEGEVKEMKRGAGLSFRERLKLRKKVEITYLVTMLYANGTIKHYLIQTPRNYFVLNKKRYHLNKEIGGWYDINFHQTRLLFHENYVEPLDKEIGIEGAKAKAFLTVTPENLEPFIEMEYVKVLSKSQVLTKWIKMCIFLVAINLMLNFVIVMVFVAQSGIFKGMLGGLTGG